MDRPTRYTFEVECADLGEYDALFVTAAVREIAELMGAAGVNELAIRVRRQRFGEP